jgi:hypothetical protein
MDSCSAQTRTGIGLQERYNSDTNTVLGRDSIINMRIENRGPLNTVRGTGS